MATEGHERARKEETGRRRDGEAGRQVRVEWVSCAAMGDWTISWLGLDALIVWEIN